MILKVPHFLIAKLKKINQKSFQNYNFAFIKGCLVEDMNKGLSLKLRNLHFISANLEPPWFYSMSCLSEHSLKVLKERQELGLVSRPLSYVRTGIRCLSRPVGVQGCRSGNKATKSGLEDLTCLHWVSVSFASFLCRAPWFLWKELGL